MSKMLKSGTIACATLAATLGISAPASAVIATFSSFAPNSTAHNIRWQRTAPRSGNLYTIATNGGTVPASVMVKFSFLSAALAPYVSDVASKFTLFASVTNSPATLGSGQLVQNLGTGSFSFLSTAPITIGSTTYATGSNLLSATFDHAALFGSAGGTSGSLSASSGAGDTLVYSSDFMSFPAGDTDFSIALTAISPVVSRANANSALNNFRATANGNFSAAVVPEPASWALMVTGFGLVGVAARRRPCAVVA